MTLKGDAGTRELGEDASAQIARWERERAPGRLSFILRRGVLTWGVPAALLTIIYKVVQEQGFVHTPQLTASIQTAIVVAFVIFPVCGWLFGRWLWELGEARYKAQTRDEASVGTFHG